MERGDQVASDPGGQQGISLNDRSRKANAVIRRVRCPQCGDGNYQTDPVCLSCGADMPSPRRSPTPNQPRAHRTTRARWTGKWILWVTVCAVGIMLLWLTGFGRLVVLLLLSSVCAGVIWLVRRVDRAYPGRSAGASALFAIIAVLWTAAGAWLHYVMEHGDEFDALLPSVLFLALTVLLGLLWLAGLLSGIWRN